jgi:hypothetical protein
MGENAAPISRRYRCVTVGVITIGFRLSASTINNNFS